MKFQSNRGFTILELLVAIAVLVILMTLALPNLRSIIQNNRMTAQANGFLTAFQLARTEAVRRGAPISVCASSDGATCTGTWDQGWIVFVDGNAAGSGSAVVDEVLQIWDGMTGGTSNAGDSPGFIRYVASGSVDGSAGTTFPVTFELEIPECTGENNRDLEISPTGRAAISRSTCS